jgi:riboflavin biosynthesis pyrimidine reductase
MMGGAELIGAFIDQGQIDEFVIHVIPTLIGEGIPLVAPRHREISLRLRSCKSYSDGVVRLHYSVTKQYLSGSGTRGLTRQCSRRAAAS